MHFIHTLCLIFITLAGLCQSSACIINKTPETYVIDMSQPADVRWAQAYADYGQNALIVYNFLVDSFPSDLVSQMMDVSGIITICLSNNFLTSDRNNAINRYKMIYMIIELLSSLNFLKI